jgi:DNA-binding NarL/FixJ family response regulator
MNSNLEINHLSEVIIADNQAITAAGIYFFVREYNDSVPVSKAGNKKELIRKLLLNPHVLVVLDYALFDIAGPEELIIIQHRFPNSHFLLFSEELTDNFLKKIYNNTDNNVNAFSIILKDCTQEEVNVALAEVIHSRPYICPRINSQLLIRKQTELITDKKLTATEKEILRLIALGKSTKEIALERFLSIHTIITHRKNIFRKLDVNNVHEAIKYALRAGIIDASDYYI